MHRRTFFKKHYDRTQLQAGIMVCRLCHKAIHRFYDEMTLAKQYYSQELLLTSEPIQQHILWASKQKR
jgi:predicted HNH restriction endonuclease